MYYTRNSFTGRLIGTSQLKAYSPQGLQKLGAAEPVNPYPPTWAAAETRTYTQKTVDHASTRSASTTAAPFSGAQHKSPSGINYAPVPEHIKRAQELFQKPDKVLVHLKGGPKDKVLYYIAMGLITVGVAGVLQMVYTLAYPRKPE